MMRFNSTVEIPIPQRLIDQVIGQEEAVEIIKLAANQKRSILLLGEPGTGKSLLASAMAELLPPEAQEDVICLPNPEQRTHPLIQVVKAGEGEKLFQSAREQAKQREFSINFLLWFALAALLLIGVFYAYTRQNFYFLFGVVFLVPLALWFKRRLWARSKDPDLKVLVNRASRQQAPFIDATGSHAGALLGDVRHDPFQSGGVETPTHQLIEVGAIHLAHKGVLFIDEVSTLSLESQQSLLTAFQEKKLAITGRSPGSSGSMVRSAPIPCDFLLVLAGNLEDIDKMHPALRSRIRGYGYEIHMKEELADTELNRYKLAQFVAQEVKKDGKIPHFSYEAFLEVVAEAGRMSAGRGRLTTKFRELGGLIRAAGDIARRERIETVEAIHVKKAREINLPLETQIARYRSQSVQHRLYLVEGKKVGQVNGVICVEGIEPVVLPVWAEAQAFSIKNNIKHNISLLGFSASANLTKTMQAVLGAVGDWAGQEIFVEISTQYRNFTWEDCPLAAVLAARSALQQKAVRQNIAILGGVNIKGEVLPTSLLPSKLAVLEKTGITKVLIPKENEPDLPGQINLKVYPVGTVDEAWSVLQSGATSLVTLSNKQEDAVQ